MICIPCFVNKSHFFANFLRHGNCITTPDMRHAASLHANQVAVIAETFSWLTSIQKWGPSSQLVNAKGANKKLSCIAGSVDTTIARSTHASARSNHANLSAGWRQSRRQFVFMGYWYLPNGANACQCPESPRVWNPVNDEDSLSEIRPISSSPRHATYTAIQSVRVICPSLSCGPWFSFSRLYSSSALGGQSWPFVNGPLAS